MFGLEWLTGDIVMYVITIVFFILGVYIPKNSNAVNYVMKSAGGFRAIAGLIDKANEYEAYTNEQKLNYVIVELTNILNAKGITIKESLVRLVIEMVYNKIKGNI